MPEINRAESSRAAHDAGQRRRSGHQDESSDDEGHESDSSREENETDDEGDQEEEEDESSEGSGSQVSTIRTRSGTPNLPRLVPPMLTFPPDTR